MADKASRLLPCMGLSWLLVFSPFSMRPSIELAYHEYVLLGSILTILCFQFHGCNSMYQLWTPDECSVQTDICFAGLLAGVATAVKASPEICNKEEIVTELLWSYFAEPLLKTARE